MHWIYDRQSKLRAFKARSVISHISHIPAMLKEDNNCLVISETLHLDRTRVCRVTGRGVTTEQPSSVCVCVCV